MPEYKKVLLIQLRQLGDIILSTPCIREIRRELPKAHITFLCHKMGKQVLEDNPYLDELIYYHENDSYIKYVNHFRQLRFHSFDLVIDFMNDPRSGLFTLVCKGKHKISTDSSRRLLYHQTYPRAHQKEAYIVDEKFSLLEASGFSPKSRLLDFPWFEHHLAPTKQLFSREEFKKNMGSTPIKVVISPTHRRPIRKWALERYCDIASKLVNEWGATVTWIWGPGEEDEIDKAIALCPAKTHKAPQTSFKELAALIANHHLFLGNSNGPSHLAVASNICSLQLHGHTKASSWCPLNHKHQAIQTPDFHIENPATLEKISVKQVWDKLNSLKPEIEKEAIKQHKHPKINWSS